MGRPKGSTNKKKVIKAIEGDEGKVDQVTPSPQKKRASRKKKEIEVETIQEEEVKQVELDNGDKIEKQNEEVKLEVNKNEIDAIKTKLSPKKKTSKNQSKKNKAENESALEKQEIEEKNKIETITNANGDELPNKSSPKKKQATKSKSKKSKVNEEQEIAETIEKADENEIIKASPKKKQASKSKTKKPKIDEEKEAEPVETVKDKARGKKRASKKEKQSVFEDEVGSSDEEQVEIVDNNVNDQLLKLQQLRKKMKESSAANKQEVYLEFQRSKINPKFEAKVERQRLEAERLQARLEASERGEDYERSRFWEYSAEQVEKWEEKEREKEERMQNGFTDHMQAAEKRYNRLVNKIKPNMNAYYQQKNNTLPTVDINQLATASELKKDNKSVQYLPIHPKPSEEAKEKLADHVKQEIAKRGKFSKFRPDKEDEDVTYINDRNKHFNKKIARAFDKYTKEIKDNFERGTAL